MTQIKPLSTCAPSAMPTFETCSPAGDRQHLSAPSPTEFNHDRATTQYHSLHEWFETQVQATPDAIALTYLDHTLTYQELNQRANQLAHYLLAHGLQPQALVAISMHRCLEMVIAFWGVLKAGGAYVPIDPTYPSERQQYMLQDSQAQFMLTQQSLVSSLPAHAATVVCLDTEWATAIAAYPTHNPALPATPAQPAYMIYTSGSTGNPKGVKIAHRGVMNHSAAMTQAFELDSGDRMLQFSSISFDIIVEELFPTLLHGATLVLRTEAMATSIRQFLEFVETHQITILDLPTAFWHELVNGLAFLRLPMPPTVRLVVVGGEKASRVTYTQWVNLVGSYPRWLNTYGPTETTVTATLYDPIQAQYQPEQGEIPIGKPISNVEIYILSPELQPVPFGEVGELHIGGPGLAIEYHQLPSRTAAKFIPNPFSDDPTARLYKTGDTVRYLPDGNLEFVGRIDFQVKLRGFRIELGEIETALEQHPTVQQAIVLAREEVPGQKYLVGYLVATPEHTLDWKELRQFLQQKLPTYMVPTAFVALQGLPLTPNGKVDRAALPALQDKASAPNKMVMAPANPTESKLLQMWEKILGIGNISTTDNFFELGGQSLMVARLLDQIAVEFGQNLPLSTLLHAPTIDQLAAVLTQPAPLQSLTLIRPGGTQAPLFLIHDGDGETLLYRSLAQSLAPQRPVYGIRPLANDHYPMLHTRLEEMAAFYIEQMQSVQPSGPYWLGGMCAGGVIAYEMARQLEAQGHKVAMVALFDAAEPTAALRSGLVLNQRIQSLSTVLQEPARGHELCRLVKATGTIAQKAWNTLTYELSARAEQHLTRTKLQLFRYYLDHQTTPPHWLSAVSIRKTYLFAEQDYAPDTSFTGELLLFCATAGTEADQPYRELYADPVLGWAIRTPRKVQVHEVPGGHSSMLQEPHVQTLAAVLQTYLDRDLPSTAPAPSLEREIQAAIGSQH